MVRVGVLEYCVRGAWGFWGGGRLKEFQRPVVMEAPMYMGAGLREGTGLVAEGPVRGKG